MSQSRDEFERFAEIVEEDAIMDLEEEHGFVYDDKNEEHVKLLENAILELWDSRAENYYEDR